MFNVPDLIPAQGQLERLQEAALSKDEAIPVQPYGHAEAMGLKLDDLRGMATPGLGSDASEVQISSVVPSTTFKAPDGRILWLSVFRGLTEEDVDSIDFMLLKPRNINRSDLPDREDFELYRTGSKLAASRYYLDIVDGLGCNAIQMAVTPGVVDQLENTVRMSAQFNIFE